LYGPKLIDYDDDDDIMGLEEEAVSIALLVNASTRFW
jgi:hypothetical protein